MPENDFVVLNCTIA